MDDVMDYSTLSTADLDSRAADTVRPARRATDRERWDSGLRTSGPRDA